MSDETKATAVKKATELTFAELRQVITGQTEFIFKINDNVEMTFKELTQEDMADVDNAIKAKEISTSSPQYILKYSIVKLSRALKGIRVNGSEYPAIADMAKIEELLCGLGEGTLSGLILGYEGEIANKFKQVEKKN